MAIHRHVPSKRPYPCITSTCLVKSYSILKVDEVARRSQCQFYNKSGRACMVVCLKHMALLKIKENDNASSSLSSRIALQGST